MGASSGQSHNVLTAHRETLTDGSDISQFDYHLPDELIAQYPATERGESRLLVVPNRHAQLTERRFAQLGELLNPGDVLICNDSRVIPARLEAYRPTGGRVEILVERLEGDNQLRAQLRANRPIRIDDSIFVERRFRLTVTDRRRDLYVLRSDPEVSVRSMVDSCGRVPLPPYINRPLRHDDRSRYQTVYARHDGSVAAPTAGLHFSAEQIRELVAAGIGIEYVTLHVGAGTFAPVRAAEVLRHRLHSERCHLPRSVCEAVAGAKSRSSRVIAVGTTTVRVLETAALSGRLRPFSGETDLFIRPGFQFAVVDGMITNFHLPRSTLLMLVCAFGGWKRVMTAYQYAVKRGFRFYSYGDAMFIDKCPEG